MIEKLLIWIANLVLEFLYKKAQDEARIIADQIRQDRERKQTNETNEKAYEEAKTREERRKAALDLLNRSAP